MLKSYDISVTVFFPLSADIERQEAWLAGFRGQSIRPGMSMVDWAQGIAHARFVLERAIVTFAERPSPPEASP